MAQRGRAQTQTYKKPVVVIQDDLCDIGEQNSQIVKKFSIQKCQQNYKRLLSIITKEPYFESERFQSKDFDCLGKVLATFQNTFNAKVHKLNKVRKDFIEVQQKNQRQRIALKKLKQGIEQKEIELSRLRSKINQARQFRPENYKNSQLKDSILNFDLQKFQNSNAIAKDKQKCLINFPKQSIPEVQGQGSEIIYSPEPALFIKDPNGLVIRSNPNSQISVQLYSSKKQKQSNNVKKQEMRPKANSVRVYSKKDEMLQINGVLQSKMPESPGVTPGMTPGVTPRIQFNPEKNDKYDNMISLKMRHLQSKVQKQQGGNNRKKQ